MRGLPSTLAGWIVFDLFLLGVIVVGAWVSTGLDLPQGVANVIIAIVSGFLGLLTGRAMEVPSNSKVTTDSTTTTVTEPEVKE